MRGRIVLTLASFVLLSPLAVLAAGDTTAAAKRGPKAEEFYRVHGEMNALLAELAQLQIKYRTADEEKRTEIQQQWKELMAKGEKIKSRLVEAAERAYAEAPNADQQITDVLMKQLALKLQQDDYEPAFEIGKLLMENDCRTKQAPTLAAMAAMAVSEFDAAERYFKQAAASGESPLLGRDYTDRLAKMFLTGPQHFKDSWGREKAIRQREAEANNLPRVLLKTTKGDIVVELFENEAPNTVANFISLVERGFYKDVSFHRVLAGFMAQGGDPRGNGTGGPGYTIPCECYKPNHREHFRGSLSMAHTELRDTGGSQFFITFVPTVALNGIHTVFGRVISGMDVLAKIQRRDPDDKEAPRPDKIIEAKVVRKRPHKYEPVKMPE
jgi:cyclophilin family peptidyl-prolyl cis-trans isomerase